MRYVTLLQPSKLLVSCSPHVWRQYVQVDDHHLCRGMPLNSVYIVVDPADDGIRAFPARLQLGRFSSLPGRAVQPHSVAFLKTSRVGQLAIARLHPVAGHFEALAGEVVDVVEFPCLGKPPNIRSQDRRNSLPNTMLAGVTPVVSWLYAP